MSAGDRTTGRRIDHSGDGIPEPGSYWKDGRDGRWYGMTPSGQLAALARHVVVEHDDGSITAEPSVLVNGGGGILVTDGDGAVQWHGYLERGVWREV